MVFFFWCQSRFVSARPTRLVSSWFRLDRLVAISLVVGRSPWQFWNTICSVFSGLGSVGSKFIVWRVPFGVVWSFGNGGRDGG